jgi:hypothetical protein
MQREVMRQWPTSRSEVDNSVDEIKRLAHLELNPPPVDWREGWSPFHAKDLLREQVLPGNDYLEIYEGSWTPLPTGFRQV